MFKKKLRFLFISLILGIIIFILPAQQKIMVDTSNLCCLLPDPGTCHNSTVRYYYNCLGRYCDVFVYNGCDGNLNNFLTLAECERYCNAL